jgi:hypothetical protein
MTPSELFPDLGNRHVQEEIQTTSSWGGAARPSCSGRGKSQAAAPLVCGRTSYPSRFR